MQSVSDVDMDYYVAQVLTALKRDLLLVESFVSDMLSFNFGKHEFSISERTKNLEERLVAIFVSDKYDCCCY